jgi:Cu+-exporting ATPase
MAVDPVCGMHVRETPGAITAEVRGSRYLFCSDACKLEFTMPEKEVRRLKIYTTWSFATGLVILVLVFLSPWPMTWVNWVSLVLAAPIQFVAGWRFYRGFAHSIKARSANMDTLIATGTTVAFAYSVAVTLAPARYGTGAYFDTAVLIIAFILLGRTIENTMKGRATDAIRSLLDLQPRTARVLVDGKEVEKPVDELAEGDVFIVKPGERIATDGTILQGEAAVDETMVTGESLPVTRGKGESVIGGTVNTNGHLRVRADHVGSDTALAKIIQLVENAQAGTAPVQRIADRVASVFVPVVILVAVAAFVGWWTLSAQGFEYAMLAGVAVLIIACPCAIGLATPAALLVGTSKGAQNGILLKSGADLEKAHAVNVVLFDKTGTLTRGELSVTRTSAVGDASEEDVLRWAAAVEAGSEHPIGQAIVAAAEERGIRSASAEGFQAVGGRGVKGRVGAQDVLVGKPAWLRDEGVDTGAARQAIDALRARGQSAVAVAVDGRLAGVLGVADTVKPTAKEAVAALKERGLEVRMVTGDAEATAQAIAEQLGIDKVHAEVLPAEKEALIRQIQAGGRLVAMVGDGINDAPALAAAHVGIAIGSGTDVAVETGGIVLIRDDPRDVATALDLSKRTLRKIKQNLWWAFGYNVALIPVAASGRLDPIYAAAAMGLSSVSVVTNSLILKRYKPPRWSQAPAAPRTARARRRPEAKESRLAPDVDPVCGMRVDPETAEHTTLYEGQMVCFCRQACKDAFEQDPEKYVGGSRAPGRDVEPNVTFRR